MTADDVPARVLEAERRREFRRLLASSSLGCPNGSCGRLLSEHETEGWDSYGGPINARCPQ